jgi:hypothetical protein
VKRLKTKYLYSQGLKATENAIDEAAENGRVVVPTLRSETLRSATSKDNVGDHLEVAKYLYSQGVEATE